MFFFFFVFELMLSIAPKNSLHTCRAEPDVCFLLEMWKFACNIPVCSRVTSQTWEAAAGSARC